MWVAVVRSDDSLVGSTITRKTCQSRLIERDTNAHGAALPHRNSICWLTYFEISAQRRFAYCGSSLSALNTVFFAEYSNSHPSSLDNSNIICVEFGVEPLSALEAPGERRKIVPRNINVMKTAQRWISITVLLMFQTIGRTQAFESTELAVGAIIEKNDVAQEFCFRKSVQEANKLLQRHDSQRRGIQLVPVIETIDGDDSFDASRKACRLLERQVIAIFGPTTPTAVDSVQSLANQFEIPHLQIDWGYRQSTRGFALNVHPHYLAYGQALYDYVRKAEYWESIALIYYEEESLLKYDYLLRNFDQPVMLRKWEVANDNHKYVIKQFKTMQTNFRFIVDIPFWEVEEFLFLDIQLVDSQAFNVVEGANITTFSILRPTGDEGYGIRALLDDVRLSAIHDERFVRSSTPKRISASALLYDGLSLLALGLLSRARTSDIAPPTDLTCSSSRGWSPGISLMNDIKAIQPENFMGLTGTFQFDGHGWRSNMDLHILEYMPDGFRQFGYWNMDEGLVVTKNFSRTLQEMQSELKGKVLRITTKEEKPYVMYQGSVNPGEPKSTDPKHWRGFCIDLLNEIGKELNFTYTINLVPDSTYGNAKIIDGEEVWDGMVQELRTRKADLAVGSFTITYDRDRVIDFTTPFMYLGISIIYKRIEDKRSHLFSFLQPLSAPVWGYILAATIMVSLVLFVVARFSPYEWKINHPCNVNSNIVENKFNILNSIWFTFGALMQKGSDVVPHATSTRIIAGFWWFFTLIVISSYTANLAAFLTVARMESPIENAEDLAKQTKIKYGTIQGGSTAAFFEQTKFPTYKRMWQFMSSQKGVMMNSTEEAIRRVKREEYAYILESTMNEYYTKRDCELMQVGGLLDSKGYGIGLPEGSKYRDPISETILKLQHSQTIDKLKFRWWQEMDINVSCDAKQTKKSDTTSLGVEKVGGCFVMLLIGMGASLIVSLFEFLYDAYQRMAHSKRSLHEEVARAFRFSTTTSSLRSRMAEEATKLPPIHLSGCVTGEKTNFGSALAYAPCLPPPEFPPPKPGLSYTNFIKTPVVADRPQFGVGSDSSSSAPAIEIKPRPDGVVDANDLDEPAAHDSDSRFILQQQHPQQQRQPLPSYPLHRHPEPPVDSGFMRPSGLHPPEENVDEFDDDRTQQQWLAGPSPNSMGLPDQYPLTTQPALRNISSNNWDDSIADHRLGSRSTLSNAPDFLIKKVSC
ncbi:glutamate receptor ionotropic kainate 3 [Clonorchis sinensis]|uniref:Glutamate receptor 1 n=1 Tax=Clonorchis sinensis TaxID=79923 RepID=G7YT81_CLOSI|nr:glutamate receptor ionotropic kainate 3 [Clonorchis sinensis]